MEVSAARFEKHLFICENKREEGACCAPHGEKLREALKRRIKELGLSDRIRVSRSGCLDVCADGPNVLLVPDNLWFKRVTEADVEAVIKRAKEGLS